MKSDSLIIIAAAAAGLLLIYKVTSKPAQAAGAAVSTGPAATYGNPGLSIGPALNLGNLLDSSGVSALSAGAAQVFGSDPYGIAGPSTIGNPNNGTSSLMTAGGIMGAFQ